MQITVREAKVVSTGTGAKGEWELIRVTSEDNTEYTTFDKAAKHLTVGSVIEFEPLIKAGKVSFKGFKVISEGQVSSSPEAKPGGMSKEDWADKQRVERTSIENQVRAKLIVELRVAGIIDDKNALYQKCLIWLDKLGDGNPPSLKEQPKQDKPKVTRIDRLQRLVRSAKKGDYTPEQISAYLPIKYDVQTSTELNEDQIMELTVLIEAGLPLEIDNKEKR